MNYQKSFFILVLMCLSCMPFYATIAQSSGGSQSQNLREQESLNYLIKTLKNLKIYSRRYPQFPSCVMFVTEDLTDGYIEIRLREKHEGIGCKGDPNVSPTLDVYRIMNTKPMKVFWLDSSSDKYTPILESLKAIR